MNDEMGLQEYGANLMLRRCVVGFGIAILLITQATADDRLEMQIDSIDARGVNIHGMREVEAGDYQKGIEKLESLLARKRLLNSTKVRVLSGLCVAYTKIGDFEAASQNCDQAIATGWSDGLAYNNRGVLNVAKGDYVEAIGDFHKATQKRGARRVGAQNLDRANRGLLARQSQQQTPATQGEEAGV
jgi:Flp pilus assembly protein TadD